MCGIGILLFNVASTCNLLNQLCVASMSTPRLLFQQEIGFWLMALFVRYKARGRSAGTQFLACYNRREFLLWQLPVYERSYEVLLTELTRASC
ncbi:hypothetical protein GGI42DRAFT_323496 [Trichoderma sp. SZMC 28013]